MGVRRPGGCAARWVLLILATYAGTCAVTWHAHFYLLMPLIRLLARLDGRRLLPTSLLAAWLLGLPLVYLLAYLLILQLARNGFGMGMLALDLLLLAWSAAMLRKPGASEQADGSVFCRQSLSFHQEDLNMKGKTVFTALILLLALGLTSMTNLSSGRAREVASAPLSTTITLWHGEDNSIALEQIAAGFVIMQPEVTMILEHKSDLVNEFIAAASSGGGPDLVYGPNDWIGPFAEPGLIQTVDDEFNPDDFVEQAVAGASWNDHYWGIPSTYGNHLMLYFNKSLLATPPVDTVEMIEVAKGLTGGGQYGLVYHLDEPFWLIPWLTGFGGWVLDDNLNPPFPTLDTLELANALQFIHDLRWVHGVVPDGEVDYGFADSLFRDGKAAMMINGDWTLDAYRDHFGEANLGVARIPLVVDTANWPQPMVSGKYYFISTHSSGDALAASRSFLQYATSKAPQLRWPEETGVLPALLEAFNDPAVQGDPILQASADQASIGSLMPTSEAMGCVWNAMFVPLQLLWDDLVTPQAAATAMQSEAELCYGEITRQSTYLPAVMRKP